jgi:hypothetical protein
MSNTHSPPFRRSILWVRQMNASGLHHNGRVSGSSTPTQGTVVPVSPVQHHGPFRHDGEVVQTSAETCPGILPSMSAAREESCTVTTGRLCSRVSENPPSLTRPIALRLRMRSPRISRCAMRSPSPKNSIAPSPPSRSRSGGCLVAPTGARLSCEDGNGDPVFQKPITWTDFPLDEVEFYCVDNTILLPGEY